MTADRWAQIRQIFDRALERPEVDRPAFLRVACARDEELRREVESLLASYQESSEFLNEPIGSVTQTMAHLGDETPEYPPGYRVGPYQLQKCIGRGGMGSVWLASRSENDFKKTVAVKLVKRGMDTQEILRRFRLERQVLARLDHPHIAGLIDGGSTQDGLPYLVMEYVKGTRIDQYCEGRQSTITERLKLFRDLCSAVQYAHQNLVVHRDIKAGNILVTSDGVAKLLDFGIAKLLRTEFSTLSPAETRPDLRPMTLDYASPEQIRGEPITTATDVYSLGVLLYRLLTGKFPYGPVERTFAALQKAICEKEPIRPSAVILTDDQFVIPQATQKLEAGDVETRLKARHRLKKKLAGDLDMIVLMALRKEPQRRYASVEQFSEDIRRYLEGRPVIARSDTFGYRAAKFIGRNVAGVIAAGLVGVVLIGATVTSERAAVRENEARVDAEKQLQVEEAATIRQEHDLMDAYFRLAEYQKPGSPAVLETYRTALAAAQSFAREHPGLEPVYGLAHAAEKVGDLASGEALERYRESLAQLDAALDKTGSDYRADYLRVARKLGLAQFRSGDRVGALATFSPALRFAENALTREDSGQTRRQAAACNIYVGEVLARNGEDAAATPKLRKALDLYRGLAPSIVAVSQDTSVAYERGLAQLAARASPEIQQEIEEALAEFRR
ncbi:MAG: serine/threonine protein kinase [Bryobacteraceae bacterium]